MKDPMTLLDDIKNNNLQKDLPPVDEWHPEHCGDSEICIRRDGTWTHQGDPFKREKLVKMFSRIIRLDRDGEYYLVTPVEKMLLTVEDVPFLVVGFELVVSEGVQRIVFETSLGDQVVVDAEHPMTVQTLNDEPAPYPAPYVVIRKNLKARIARSVFYQLIDVAVSEQQGVENVLFLESSGERFELGRF
ncbi:hypothetical protein A9Q81_16530 [Gammaproteobacteria bacterium 42_54_T18]|nr:hypothetical protein A9Q81_16530 [Gammaproteobacteria bacterium 42_54_T18]